MARTLKALLPLLAPLGLAACPSDTNQATSNLAHPQDIAVICVDARAGLALLAPVAGVCDLTRHTLVGFVPNGELGDLAVVTVASGGFVDQDPFTPGFTRRPVGGQPTRALAAPDGTYVYLVNAGTQSLDRMKVAKLSLDLERQALPGTPSDVAITVDGDTQTAWVTIPERGEVVHVPLGEGFGALDAATLTSTQVGGTPRRIAARVDNGEALALYVTHATLSVLTELDPKTGEVAATIPFAPACRDGIDNDGDGLVDGADPSCEAPDGASEDKPVIEGDLPACADGIDNDGDGLADFPDDPGCRAPLDPTEYSGKPACSDGLDNDGDGLADLADPDCGDDPRATSELPQCGDGEDDDGDGAADFGGDGTLADDRECAPFGNTPARQSNAEFEYPTTCNDGIDNDGDGLVDAAPVADGIGEDPDCSAPWANGEARPKCTNGVDDDGDGLVDADDPDCYTRGGGSEAPTGALPNADLAISPNGRWVYVTDQALGTVEVIDAEARVHVDVNARETDGDPALAFTGVSGVEVPGTPLSVAFAATTTVEGEEQLPAQTAFVSTSLGYVYAIDAQIGDEARHLQRGTVTANSRGTVSQPDLTIGEDSFAQGLSVQAEFANLGPFTTNPAEGRYYGVQLGDDPRLTRTESWSVTHAGTLLDRSDAQTGAIVTADGLFHDPWADYCAAGIEPGDVLVLDPGYRIDCAAPGSAARWIGDTFEVRIKEVRVDSLVLDPVGAVGVLDDLVDGEPTCGHVAAHKTFAPGADATPHPTCFPSIAGYTVRAPEGTFVVRGGRSGFLHRVVNKGGQCVVDEDQDPRLTGRAQMAVLAEATALSCAGTSPGATPLDDALIPVPFSNLAFTLEIRPGCCTRDDGVGELVTDPPVDLRWRFNVTSALTPLSTLGGTIPSSLRAFDVDGRLYVIDQGLDVIRRYLTSSLTEGTLLF